MTFSLNTYPMTISLNANTTRLQSLDKLSKYRLPLGREQYWGVLFSAVSLVALAVLSLFALLALARL